MVFQFLAESKIMKRWAILTVLIYALALFILTVPMLWLAFHRWSDNTNSVEIFGLFKFWGYWLWLAILVTGQALLLLLPINIAERRLPARRPLKIPVIVTAFFLGNLLFAGIISIICAVYGDKVPDSFDLAGSDDKSGIGALLTGILFLMIFWLVWSIVFRRATQSDEPAALLKRATRWLLRGSILELLVAVPSHVIVRRRDDCCAPIGTFWGIATGISIMLLCFGPGVFFLFAERCRKLKPKAADTDKKPE
jgi:uncharacterized membrane protein YhaH (DUF805 family)